VILRKLYEPQSLLVSFNQPLLVAFIVHPIRTGCHEVGFDPAFRASAEIVRVIAYFPNEGLDSPNYFALKLLG
jgi:hypothetical protein